MRAIIVKSFIFSLVVLFISFISSFLFPFLYKYIDCCFWLFYMGLPGVLGIVLFLLLLFYCLFIVEDNKFNLGMLAKRLRLSKINKKHFLHSILIFILIHVLSTLFQIMLKKLNIPLDYDESITAEAYNNQMPSNFIIYLYPIALIFGGALEEFIWRGYLLPLQEKKMKGNMAWILNGFLWAMTHMFVYNPLKILVVALGYSFIAYKYKNTWFTIFFHILTNGFIAVGFLKTMNIF